MQAQSDLLVVFFRGSRNLLTNMDQSQPESGKRIPAVDFYGDTSSWPLSELVHCEKLAERSELHDWQIRPHRHNDLTQLFIVLDGSGKAGLDSVWQDVQAPCVLIVPQRCVHEFDWAPSSDGYVLSIRSNVIAALEQRIEALGKIFNDARVIDISDSRQFIGELLAEIHAESQQQRSLKDVSLDSLVRVLAIWIARHSIAGEASTALSGRSLRHFTQFMQLVDAHHKRQWRAARYAKELGITASHLNTICHQQAGKSTLEIIHERLILAARRELAYTENNVAGVAYRLGFDDPSNFTRFFKRETGMTPGAYRRRSGTIDADGR